MTPRLLKSYRPAVEEGLAAWVLGNARAWEREALGRVNVGAMPSGAGALE